MTAPETSRDALSGWRSEFDSEVHPETVWTAANIQEALPGLLTPMTWSLMSAVLDYGFSQPARRAGVFVPAADPYVALFYGRAFLNATAFRAWSERVPFGATAALDEHYLGQASDGAGRHLPSVIEVGRAVPLLARMLWIAFQTPAEIAEHERLVEAAEARDRALRLESMEAPRLVREIESAMPLAKEVAALHIGVSGATNSAFDWLSRLTRAWLGDEDGSLVAVLCTGLTDVESARPGKALWELSRYAETSPAVAGALASIDAPAALALLRRSDDTGATEFVAAYDRFVERFGHRGVMETELSAASWGEDPATVFAALRTLAESSDTAGPEANEAQQVRLRLKATAEALARLSLPQRLLFDAILARTQRYLADRERTKSLLVRGLHRCRGHLRGLGRELAARSVMAAAEDVFYLTFEEVKAVSTVSSDLREVVARRLVEAERNRDVVLPETFSGRPQPLAPATSDAASTAVTVLKGIPVSPGRVTATARVVLDPRLDHGLVAGEVLVAPVTDAAWMPLFLVASAVVVDIGGPLSHGATVARELGLPAVVSVKEGTKRIRSGDRITVDGRAGTVEIEPAGAT